MNQKNQQPKEQKEHRFDPELLKIGLHCDLDQLEMLMSCSGKKDITVWNDWRKEHPDVDIWLEGANIAQAKKVTPEQEVLHRAYLKSINLSRAYLKKADLRNADFNKASFFNAQMEEAKFEGAQLEEAYFEEANLKRANFLAANLKDSEIMFADLEGAVLNSAILNNAQLHWTDIRGAYFRNTHIKNSKFGQAIVDGQTTFWECEVDGNTDFRGVSLNNIRIDPATKQLLEHNIRRKNWEEWYTKGKKWQRILKRLFIRTFWLISDYGISTKRIIFTFFGLAFVFALLYRLFPDFVMVYGEVGDIRGFWHALYFSVVTMTTLGFGDIAANPDSWAGQAILMAQVILGYVLLGALVTRFAVLFTAGGPAGKFEDEKKEN